MIINCRVASDDQYSPDHQDLVVDLFDSASFQYTFWANMNKMPHWYSEKGLDLLYISLAVFAADRLSLRLNALDGWSRGFEIHIPVLEIDIWNEVKASLEEMLYFLSGDSWKFSFRQRELTSYERSHYSKMQKTKMPVKDYDQMCMFSGGLDSFIGAIDLLEDTNASTLFVSHYGGGKGTKEYQDALKMKFVANYGIEERDFHQYYAKVVSGIENTTRTRSFMFFSHAIAVASTLGKPVRLIIPENGFISLNIPGTFSKLGTSSTRTTHPHYISLFQKLINIIGIEVTLVNPYQFCTKGEMIQNCKNLAFLEENITNTMSCSHPDSGRMEGERKPKHCGYCLPCVIRQAAVKKAGIVDGSPYRDSGFMRGNTARTYLNSYRLALEHFDSKHAFLHIQGNGPIIDNIEEYACLYTRGMDELRTYLGGI